MPNSTQPLGANSSTLESDAWSSAFDSRVRPSNDTGPQLRRSVTADTHVFLRLSSRDPHRKRSVCTDGRKKIVRLTILRLENLDNIHPWPNSRQVQISLTYASAKRLEESLVGRRVLVAQRSSQWLQWVGSNPLKSCFRQVKFSSSQQESRSVSCLSWEERSGKVLILPLDTPPHPSQPTEDDTPTVHAKIRSSTQEKTHLPRPRK